MVRTRRGLVISVLGALAFAASCAPPTPPQPAPLVECEQVAGGITYTPPATNSGEDITIATEPGAELRGCVDNTGSGITRADLDLSVLLPGYLCAPLDVGQLIGSGGGALDWSDGSLSTISAEVFGGSGGSFVTELTITGGRWSGARGSVATFVTSAEGWCDPSSGVTRAFLLSDDPIAFVAPVAPLLPPRRDFVEVDTGGGGTTCATMADAGVTCWGDNTHGQLGNLLLAPGSQTSVALPVTGLAGATSVSVGGDHVCATLGDGGVRCWGENGSGQLGSGSTLDSTVPVDVTGLGDVEQVSAGYRRTCALLADTTVRCWGEGAGPGGAFSTTPVPVASLSGVTELTAGSWHHCALSGDGTVRCWGGNQYGQLGDGTTTDSLVPVPVAGSLPQISQVSAGSEHTCALDTTGEAWCWGFNRYGQLGQGSPGETPLTTPSRVIGNLSATQLDAGGVNTCALVTGGSVSCWGGNDDGQLGTGTTTSSARPTLVLGLRVATSVSAGGSSCATLPGGRADCWGNNVSGQLGTGTLDDSAVPVPVIDP